MKLDTPESISGNFYPLPPKSENDRKNYIHFNPQETVLSIFNCDGAIPAE